MRSKQKDILKHKVWRKEKNFTVMTALMEIKRIPFIDCSPLECLQATVKVRIYNRSAVSSFSLGMMGL